MKSKWLGRIGLTALVLGVVGSSSGMVGCASERDPINRVQLNAIPKSFLVGANYTDAKDDPEFYARSMLIKVPYGQSGGDAELFTNSINSVSKIKWQIQESKLVGRVSLRAHHRAPTSRASRTTVADQADPTKPLAQNDGLVVYEFAIEKQFDIRRAYNAQTGEESNVVEENDHGPRLGRSRLHPRRLLEEPRHHRLRLRHAVAARRLQRHRLRAARVRHPQPEDPNAPQFDLDKGYFDVTNKLFANPKMIDFGDGFKFPGCMLPNLISGGTSPTRQLQPERAHDPSLVQEGRGHRLRARSTGTARSSRPTARSRRSATATRATTVSSTRSTSASSPATTSGSAATTTPTRRTMTGAMSCRSSTIGVRVGIGTVVKGMSHCDTFNEKCTLPFKDRVAEADRLALRRRQPGPLLRLEPRSGRGVGHRDARRRRRRRSTPSASASRPTDGLRQRHHR